MLFPQINKDQIHFLFNIQTVTPPSEMNYSVDEGVIC